MSWLGGVGVVMVLRLRDDDAAACCLNELIDPPVDC